MSDQVHLASAPRFGLNARELILRAFREEASGDADFEFSSAAELEGKVEEGGSERQQQASLAVVKLVTVGLLEAVPKAEVPVVAYVPHSRVPKVHRQGVLSRLAAEHLALALHQAGHHSDPEFIRADHALRKHALEDALQQELSLYKRASSSRQVYLNLAVRTKAYQWVEASTAACQQASHDDSISEPASLHTLADSPCDQAEADVLPIRALDNLGEEKTSRNDGLELVPVEGNNTQNSSRPLRTDSAADTVSRNDEVEVVPAEGNNTQNSRRPLRTDSAAVPSTQRPAKRLKATTSPLAAAEPVAASEADCSTQSSAPPQKAVPAGLTGNKKGDGLPEAKVSGPGNPPRRDHTCVAKCTDYNLKRDKLVPPADQPFAAPQEVNFSRHSDKAAVEAAGARPGARSAQQPRSTGSASTPVEDGVRRFVRACLDPLYSAKIIDRELYRSVTSKVTKKVSAMHANETSASFLITYGDKVRKLVQQYVNFATNTSTAL